MPEAQPAAEYHQALLLALPDRDVLLVAVGVALMCEERILLHQRPDGLWSLPGGHVHPGESLEAAILRETLEETGLTLLDAEFWTLVSGPGTARPDVNRCRYYVTVMFRASRYSGKLQLSHESVDLRWFDVASPSPSLSVSVRAVLSAIHSGAPVPALTTLP